MTTATMPSIRSAGSRACVVRDLARFCVSAVTTYAVCLGYLATLAAGTLAALALGIPLRDMCAELDKGIWQPGDGGRP